MVDLAEDHPWSSAPARCGLRKDPLLSQAVPPPGVIEAWAEWLRVEDEPDAVDRIRRQTKTGRPCGGSPFIAQLEHLLGRVLHPAKRGRKPKPAGESSGEEGNS